MTGRAPERTSAENALEAEDFLESCRAFDREPTLNLAILGRFWEWTRRFPSTKSS